MTAFLLIETNHGDVVAVRFPDEHAAREWEDKHSADLDIRGCVRLVGKAEALRLSS